ncbi:hypothetical protein THAOC_18902 [Thalassiosira oceanica]|uniref:Uncharacterized protein n=1 Tax=Thalassiosira oceanica TaxID=159749 RepID=K0S662_THAOC|nr:hypothetical protein THAOC_18902 [Thalassiosira oceanica]|eukprot:EJK60700.1 hypothetical protein THAOC_18902 [Thalassiosira oceanica]
MSGATCPQPQPERLRYPDARLASAYDTKSTTEPAQPGTGRAGRQNLGSVAGSDKITALARNGTDEPPYLGPWGPLPAGGLVLQDPTIFRSEPWSDLSR